MLILPIVNKKRVMNVEIKLKGASKVKRGIVSERDMSEIIVNRERFSQSSFSNSKDKNAPIDFIRSKSLLYPRRFLVTTKREDITHGFDVYEVGQPPKKVTEGLDTLYSKAILDMKNEVPKKSQRGRYVSLEELGFLDVLGDERISKLQNLIKNGRGDLGRKLEEAGLIDMVELIDYFNSFECSLISDSAVGEDSIQETIDALGVINSRDYRNLKKYYNMAKSNTDIYTKISYINKIVYDRPLVLTKQASGGRQFVKEREYKNAA